MGEGEDEEATEERVHKIVDFWQLRDKMIEAEQEDNEMINKHLEKAKTMKLKYFNKNPPTGAA